jgi:hypothetical protein
LLSYNNSVRIKGEIPNKNKTPIKPIDLVNGGVKK